MRRYLSLHSLFSRVNTDLTVIAAFALDSDLAGNLCEQRIILADTNIVARMEMRAALTNEDAASRYDRAGMLLDAEALGLTVAAVTRGADALLMCETLKFKLKHGIHLHYFKIRTALGYASAMAESPNSIVCRIDSVCSSGLSLSSILSFPLAAS